MCKCDLFIYNYIFYSKIPLWGQKVGRQTEEFLVIWDYHVIMIHLENNTSRVYDFDSVLPFPVSGKHYFDLVLRHCRIKDTYQYQFRVINAEDYLQTFASDRSRMKDNDGNYLKPPPAYECIRTENETNNLNKFISMETQHFQVGEIMSWNQMKQLFVTSQ